MEKISKNIDSIASEERFKRSLRKKDLCIHDKYCRKKSLF